MSVLSKILGRKKKDQLKRDPTTGYCARPFEKAGVRRIGKATARRLARQGKSDELSEYELRVRENPKAKKK